jgi:hypothetical protein
MILDGICPSNWVGRYQVQCVAPRTNAFQDENALQSLATGEAQRNPWKERASSFVFKPRGGVGV